MQQPNASHILLLSLLCLLLGSTAVSAPLPMPNLMRSLDLQKQYQNKLEGQQVLELSTPKERFIGLWIEQRTSAPEGGVLMLHDLGQTPDWPYLLQQTRQYLPDTGWSTLAIDLPTPNRDAIGLLPTADEAPPEITDEPEEPTDRIMARIQAGIAQLNDAGIFNIAILGYGDGAYWGTRYLAERLTEQEEQGYALIWIEAPLQQSDFLSFSGQLNIPTLDVYMKDSEFAHRQAKARKATAMRAKHPDYLQIHDALRQNFYGAPDIDRTTRRIWGWLRNHAAGYEAALTQ